jgi:Arc/MetJ-type ribon-helix-helix transcriptional regulator
MYFSIEQANALAAVSRERRVSKSAIVRYAVEKLLKQLDDGHVELPLGVKD